MQRLHEKALDDEIEPFFRVRPLPRRKFANCLDTKTRPARLFAPGYDMAIRGMCPLLAPHRMDDARVIGADCVPRLGTRYPHPPAPPSRNFPTHGSNDLFTASLQIPKMFGLV